MCMCVYICKYMCVFATVGCNWGEDKWFKCAQKRCSFIVKRCDFNCSNNVNWIHSIVVAVLNIPFILKCIYSYLFYIKQNRSILCLVHHTHRSLLCVSSCQLFNCIKCKHNFHFSQSLHLLFTHVNRVNSVGCL